MRLLQRGPTIHGGEVQPVGQGYYRHRLFGGDWCVSFSVCYLRDGVAVSEFGNTPLFNQGRNVDVEARSAAAQVVEAVRQGADCVLLLGLTDGQGCLLAAAEWHI